MNNPIRDILQRHAAHGYNGIKAYEDNLLSLYQDTREKIARELRKSILQGKTGLVGPRFASMMRTLTDEIFPEFEAEYRSVVRHALDYLADKAYRLAGYDLALGESVLGKMDKRMYENVLADDFSHVAGATRKMLDTAVSDLRRKSARCMREASLTGMTRREISRRLLSENMVESGFQFIAANGQVWDGENYFEMLGRTMLHNNARECYLAGCAESGSDIVTIVESGGEVCDACRKWEGRLMSISGKTKGLPLLSDAQADGLFHPRCTHSIVAVPESVAGEYYTEEGKEKEEVLGNLDHKMKRADQWARAKAKRTEREAKLIGAPLIKGEHTVEQDLLATNPNFGRGIKWRKNCQRCITAYEARCRGIDVEAKPIPPMPRTLDPLSRSCGWGNSYQGGILVDCCSDSGLRAKEKVVNAISIMPEGARCAVQIYLKKEHGGGGHVFVAEKKDGIVVFHDPQMHGMSDQKDASSHFIRANGEGCYIMRLDNLKFSDTVKECAEGVINKTMLQKE